MKRLLLGMAATIVATAAFAQEETASEVTHSGDIRVRYFSNMNTTMAKDAADNSSFAENRVKLNLNYQKSEDLSAFISLLYNGVLGDRTGAVAPGTTSNANTIHNAYDGVTVNQAYVWWKANETTSLTAGRMAIDIADGRVFSFNDYEVVPVTHDGLKVGFDFDFGNLGLYAIKHQELAAGGGNNDPQDNTYMLSLDLKNLPEAISTANIHVAQRVTNDIAGAGDGNDTRQHFGLTLGGETSGFTYNLTGAIQSGKDENAAGDIDYSAHMVDLLLGYGVSEEARVWLGYHMDSGDDTDATKDKRYNPMFYNAHDNAGRMDLFGWGNMTYFYLGGAYNLSEATEIGVEALMFSLTEDNDGRGLNPYRSALWTPTPGSTGGESDLGTEIDVWANHSYDNGAHIGARLGAFMPGKYFSDNDGPDETSLQFMLTGGFNF